MSRYAFIAACTEPWPVQLLCQVLAVSPTGYYRYSTHQKLDRLSGLA